MHDTEGSTLPHTLGGNPAEILPVLNYHAVESVPGEGALDFRQRDYALRLNVFREQLDLLAREGYQSLTSREMLSWFAAKEASPFLRSSSLRATEGSEAISTARLLRHPAQSGTPRNDSATASSDSLSEAKQDMSKRCVGLTFDDGLISHYACVRPELSARSFKGIFFVTPALVGTKGYMSWDHLKELLREGHEIGSHGFSHRPLTYTLAQTLWQELAGSKCLIEKNLGIIVESFSVPRAYYNSQVHRAAEKAGYRLIFGSFADVNRRGIRRPPSLNRIAIKPAMDLAMFRRLIEGQGGASHLTETIKAFLRGTLPPFLYDFAATLKQTILGRGRP